MICQIFVLFKVIFLKKISLFITSSDSCHGNKFTSYLFNLVLVLRISVVDFLPKYSTSKHSLHKWHLVMDIVACLLDYCR